MTRIFLSIGSVTTLLALADLIRLRIQPPEKAAYYLMGHWFDAFWQVQLPVMVLGVLVVTVALVCMRKTTPPD